MIDCYNCFKEIFVSTDSKKIKDISEKYGAKVPFMRPKHLSDGYTKTIDVIADAIKRLKKITNLILFVVYILHQFL